MSRQNIWRVLVKLIMVGLFSFVSITMWGQASTATLVGTVHDNSGAVVPGAEVSVTNAATGNSRSVKTGNAGEYSVTFLPVGTYSVQVKSTGFRPFEQKSVVLEVGRTARVDVSLTPGGASENITVTSEVPQINTTDASVGRTIENTEVNSLPLVNRSTYDFLTLTPGVTSNTNSNALGYQQQQVKINGSSYDRLGGNLGASVGFYLDGGFNNQGLRGTGNLAPNPDAVQEFRVVTNNYSAEYGHYSGGIVNMITKSGTNNFHGSAFEFIRNDKFNAAPWNVDTKPPLHRNQFGGTIGGPIVRNRDFFFFSYGGLRQKTTDVPGKAVVPTDLERQGDFSQSAKKPINPATGLRYPNDIIPIDPVAQAILDQYIPEPNQGGLYQALLPHPFNNDEFIVKGDHRFSDANQLSGSYYLTYGKTVEPISGGGAGNIPWSSREFSWKQHNVTLNDTWAISSTTVNQATANYVRNFGGRLNQPAVSLGDLGSTFNEQGPKSLPRITVSGYFTLGEAISGPVAGSNYYGLRDVLALTRGRHSLKVGGEVSLEKMVQNTTLDNYGTFSFDGSKTKNALADFLVGLPVKMTQDAPVNKEDNDWYYALFAQDDFHVRPNLTLNLGLRYDLQLPTTDPFDRKLTFVEGKQSTVVPTAPLGLQFVGDPGITRGVIPPRKTHFAPRIGFAWDPFSDQKTSIRGGFGLYWNSISGNEWNQSADHLPFSVRQTIPNVATLSDPYANLPGGSPFPYVYNPANPTFIVPATVAGPDLNFQWPYTYQINLSVERQITNTLSASIGYVSALNHNLAFIRDVNYPVYGPGATTSNVNLRRPIDPGVLADIQMMQSIGKDLYHSMQVSVEKRISNHFSLKGFYVWGKDIQSLGSGAQDMNNLAEERSRSDSDIRHNAVISGIWDLSYAPKGSVTSYIVNGWTISSIIRLQSGNPVNITSGKDNNLDGLSTDRPNLVGNPFLDPNRSRSATTQAWFNTAAFAANATGTDGNISPNFLDGPGSKTVDLAVFRNFPIKERTSLQLRAEAQNAFNFVNLNNPSGNFNSSQFGKITGASDMRQMQFGIRLTF